MLQLGAGPGPGSGAGQGQIEDSIMYIVQLQSESSARRKVLRAPRSLLSAHVRVCWPGLGNA